jgi:hypothetical protein
MWRRDEVVRLAGTVPGGGCLGRLGLTELALETARVQTCLFGAEYG